MKLQFYPPDTPAEALNRTKTRAICDDLLRPFAFEDDEKCFYRKGAFKELGKQGLLASFAPKAFGGSEMPYGCHYAVLEEISRASLSMTVAVGVNNIVQSGILAFGTDEQKKKYLPKLISGEWLGAFSLSESHSGSDAAALRTSAKKVSGGFSVTGTKMWCSNAGDADLFLLMARTGEPGAKGVTSFLVEKGTAGFRVGKLEKKLGLRGSTLAELIFEDCFLGEKQRLGAEGEGFKVALSQLDAGRVTIGVGGIGTAIEALAQFWSHRTRAGHFEQGERDLFSAHFAEIQAARLLVNEAARLRDREERLTIIASQVKMLGSDLAVKVSSDAITYLGPDGYKKSFGVERLLRDAKALQIVEGTNQIQRLVLSRELDRMYEAVDTP
ncbi:MAG: acyl-CoA dehydrogenase family protein [Deltaproteobacteria bacterium]|nr:acyl-CoA dehydrogenase family protein [Deltaproteobacteria bacterium]MBI3295732.1 acyl-CoA dehydrogenase family protein [Deltaproteobacteria bacterium]